MEGWIKIFRQMIDWEWYKDVPTKTLFIHLLLTANYEDKKWKGETIKRGQLVTTLQRLSEDTGLTIKQVRTALDKLESTKNIKRARKRANKGQAITVEKYEVYQGYYLEEGKEKGKQRAKTKEIKKNKEDKNINNIYNNKFNLIKSYNNYEQRDDIDFNKLYANGGGETNE